MCEEAFNVLLLTYQLLRKLSKMLKVTYIIMIIYEVTPMKPLYNGFYLFPLSRAVNSNRLIFDPSEVEIHQYLPIISTISQLLLIIYNQKNKNGCAVAQW